MGDLNLNGDPVSIFNLMKPGERAMDDQDLRELLGHTKPQPVGIRGRVLSINLHGTFSMVFDDGSVVSVSAHDKFPIKQLGQFLGDEVVVQGLGFYDRASHLVFFIGHDFTPVTPVPPLGKCLHIQTPAQRDAQSRRLKGVIGMWPGDESERAAEDAILGERH